MVVNNYRRGRSSDNIKPVIEKVNDKQILNNNIKNGGIVVLSGFSMKDSLNQPSFILDVGTFEFNDFIAWGDHGLKKGERGSTKHIRFDLISKPQKWNVSINWRQS